MRVHQPRRFGQRTSSVRPDFFTVVTARAPYKGELYSLNYLLVNSQIGAVALPVEQFLPGVCTCLSRMAGDKNGKNDASDIPGLSAKLDRQHNELKDLLKPQGKRIKKNSADIENLALVQRTILVENREEWYKFWIDCKFSSNANLIFSRSSGSGTPTTLDRLRPMVDSCFPGGPPPYIFEPVGTKGTFKLIPCTFSPLESRAICGAVIQAAKEPVREAFGLNVHYDNHIRLRQIRSRAQKLVASFLQARKLKMGGKVGFRRGVITINDIGLFPEFLVPEDEDLWPDCYEFIQPAFDPMVASGAYEDKTDRGRFYDGMAAIFARSKGADQNVGVHDEDEDWEDEGEDDNTMTD